MSLPSNLDKFDREQDVLDQRFLQKSLQPIRACHRSMWLKLACILLASLVLLVQYVFPVLSFRDIILPCENTIGLEDICPQVEAFVPPAYEALLDSLDQEFNSSEFKLKAYESLGGAIRIPTESFDDLGKPTEDPRWEVYAKLHCYLESRFPRVHANLKRTKVNTYALVYEWKGTENIKPLMLTAHMDVVPVNPATYDEWVHPPFSGYYDGTWIWGRGSCDDKPGVIGSLTVVETLLERGFVPSRTILLSFGIDEECSGLMGAGAIREYILDNYGHNSLAMLVDEGGGYANLHGTVFATPAVTEKGYLDVRMEVLTPGGHSSRPPKHTGIGVLADLITELEDHPNEPELIRGRPYYQSLECRAKYDAGFPASLKKLVSQSKISNKKLRELENRLVHFDPVFYALSGTTQAFDLVGGGIKVNALPEAVWAIANYRVADHGSLTDVKGRLIDLTLPVAGKHNMTLEAFGKRLELQGPSHGIIRLSEAFNSSVEPAPVTPTTRSGPFEILSRTIRSTFQTHLRTDELPMFSIVSPGLSTGNTDTIHYWNLTKHVFRYSHRGGADTFNGVHTVNEAMRAEAFLEQIRFLTRLILNADQSDVLE